MVAAMHPVWQQEPLPWPSSALKSCRLKSGMEARERGEILPACALSLTGLLVTLLPSPPSTVSFAVSQGARTLSKTHVQLWSRRNPPDVRHRAPHALFSWQRVASDLT